MAANLLCLTREQQAERKRQLMQRVGYLSKQGLKQNIIGARLGLSIPRVSKLLQDYRLHTQESCDEIVVCAA